MKPAAVSISQKISRFHLILEEQAVRDAWLWIITNAHSRPAVQAGNCCVYDQKRWRHDNPQALLSGDSECVVCLARLFLTSQLTNNGANIIAFVKGDNIDAVGIYSEKIEKPIKDLIEDDERFRYSLSEHIAFWMQLVSIIQSHDCAAFTVTLPNYLPEDKGPDGLSLVLDDHQTPRIELRSVKSSIHDPYYLVASGAFHNGEEVEPNSKKLLEEFYLLAHFGLGFGRLDRLLTTAFDSIKMPAEREIRLGILGNHRAFNATVVADDQFSRYEMFRCFGRISSTPSDCIATYIGSDNWAVLAESVRNCVLEILQVAGVL